jgi:hypothetical protein
LIPQHDCIIIIVMSLTKQDKEEFFEEELESLVEVLETAD